MFTTTTSCGDLTVAKIQGILSLFCLFTLFFFGLTVWCFVALILSRGHRGPYAFLFPALILSFLANANNIALEVLLNMPAWFEAPGRTIPALEAIGLFFTNWAILLLFLSMIAILWNRETAIHTAIEGKTGRHNHAFTAIYAVLALILFVLGTASIAVYVDAVRKYDDALKQIQSQFSAKNIPLQEQLLVEWLDQRRKVWSRLRYAFHTFVVVSGIVVAVSTILLWRSGRRAGIRDKVLILFTNFCHY